MQVNLHAHAKYKYYSPGVQKPSQIRLRTQQDNFFHYTETKSDSIPQTEINLIWTTITKTKPISMFTLKTCNFRLANKNKVIFFPRTKNMSISVITRKPIEFLSPT